MESAYHIVLILALALYLVSGYPIAPPPPPPPPPRRRQFKQNSAQLRVGASSPGPMMNADDHGQVRLGPATRKPVSTHARTHAPPFGPWPIHPSSCARLVKGARFGRTTYRTAEPPQAFFSRAPFRSIG